MIDKNTYESLTAVLEQQRALRATADSQIASIDSALAELERNRQEWLAQWDVSDATVVAIDRILSDPDLVPLTPPEQPITPAIVPEPVAADPDPYRTFGED